MRSMNKYPIVQLNLLCKELDCSIGFINDDVVLHGNKYASRI